MSYRFERDEPVTDALVRITREQVDKAIGELDAPELDEHHVVHQVRKRCKKIRAVYRLVRGPAEELYQRENRWYRDTGRRLGELRDAQAHLETYDLLVEGFKESVDRRAFEVIRETLEERRDDLADELDIDQRLEIVRDELVQGRERTDGIQVDVDGAEALTHGIAKTYGRARDGFTDAYDDGTTVAFHQWRKRVKYHRYHVRLLQDAWPDVLQARREELHDLTDVTGDDHDLAELRATLLTETEQFPAGEPVDAFVALLDRKRARLQREAEPLGAKLFAEDPESFVDRVRTYLDEWYAGPVSRTAVAAPVVRPGD